jgi:hypothetical protein
MGNREKAFYRVTSLLVEGIFETQQFIDMSWKDPRITFYNLRKLTFKNSLLEKVKHIMNSHHNDTIQGKADNLDSISDLPEHCRPREEPERQSPW